MQIPTEPLEVAFARNVAWLRQFGRRLPRHMVRIGWFVQRHPFSTVLAAIARWIEAGDLLADKAGDYRLTAAGEARIARLLEERVETAA